MLTINGIGVTGPSRANAEDECLIKDSKVIGKESQGTHDFRSDLVNKIINVRWSDNSIVTFTSKYLMAKSHCPS